MYFNKLIPVLVVFIFTSRFSPADTLYMKDGRQIEGVVLRDSDKEVLFSGSKGAEVINKPDIQKIDYDTEKGNLLRLADNTFADKDYVRAYYLYEKVFRLDAESDRAIEGMKKTEPYVYRNTEGHEFVGNYERFYGPAKDKEGEGKILLKNSEQTQAMQEHLGLILAASDKRTHYNRLKVTGVVPGSRADKAGLQIGDEVINLNGYTSDYMGLYDAVSLLAANLSGKIDMTIEREVTIWADNKPDGLSLLDAVGFNIAYGANTFVVSGIKETQSLKDSGLHIGDAVASIDDDTLKGKNINDVKRLIAATTPGYINLRVMRRLSL